MAYENQKPWVEFLEKPPSKIAFNHLFFSFLLVFFNEARLAADLRHVLTNTRQLLTKVSHGQHFARAIQFSSTLPSDASFHCVWESIIADKPLNNSTVSSSKDCRVIITLCGLSMASPLVESSLRTIMFFLGRYMCSCTCEPCGPLWKLAQKLR